MGACLSCGTEVVGTPKFCPECGTKLDAPATSSREARKVVTVLFSDVTGSTALGEALDPEAVRGLMGRYFAAMKAVIERHGGTVEKFIGDAIMAVFGIPTLHEDDALRAVRAAAQMREALTALNIELEAERGVTIATRTGITTGEVVAGDPAAGQTLVTGDTVNTAARLEQAATPGEILIGLPTWRLVRDAVLAEPVEAVNAKGKALPVAAYRLVSVAASVEGHLRRMDAPLVGRERELTRLQQVYRDAVEQRSPQLFTLLGAAGVGKSRLVSEFLAGVSHEARILRGRCLPYGEGITYWPLAEALREAAGISDADDRAAAQGKLQAVLDGERDAEVLVARLATAIGLSDQPAPQAELFWAVRRTLEHLARQQPTVVVFEDIHWAEPTFLDLLDHLADWSREAPLFLLVPARPELLDARSGWGGGKLNATTVLLESLPAEATARLIEALPGGSALSDALRQRITTAAEGNPLFVEELLAMLVDDGVLVANDGQWHAVGDLDRLAIPPSISALLAARLDRLSGAERRVAERASVVGRVFEPEAVAALSGEAIPPNLERELMALVRKELVRPDRSEVTGGDAFKFRHILIRDAAYNALPKRERADLHERFADWLEHATGDRASEFAEVIGHHLASAAGYRAELGETDDRLAQRAARWLLRAGREAWHRDDSSGAESLLLKAADLATGEPAVAVEALQMVGSTLLDAGRLIQADAVVKRALEMADDDTIAAAHLRVLQLHVHHHTRPGTWAAEAIAVTDEVIPLFAAAGDDLGLAASWGALEVAEQNDLAKSAYAGERALHYARLAGDSRALADAIYIKAVELARGAVPVRDAMPECRELFELAATLGRVSAANMAMPLAILEAMALDFNSARQRCMDGVGVLSELGLQLVSRAGIDLMHEGARMYAIDMAAHPAPRLAVSESEAEALRALTRAGTTQQRSAQRARIVLAAAAGKANIDIAAECGVSIPTVLLWRRRFAERGLDGLDDAPHPGRPRMLGRDVRERILAETLTAPPGATHWSRARLARRVGVSASTVGRVWREARLQPHRSETFKYSSDPALVAKVTDIVGLYLAPPERAIVLSVDEKTQIQALDHTQPMLPLRPGQVERHTHDYKRNGTTSLFAALEVATGAVTHATRERHTAADFLAFLRLVTRAYPDGELHLVLDNVSTHKTPAVQRWLQRHRRVTFHFTPTSASWMNQVETWFGILTRQAIRRGSFASVRALSAAIERFTREWNASATPFTWVKSADEILAKAVRKPQDHSGARH